MLGVYEEYIQQIRCTHSSYPASMHSLTRGRILGNKGPLDRRREIKL